MGIVTVLWEKWVEFKRDFWKITCSGIISPVLYLIAFGWGINATVDGQPYFVFLVPGIIALTTMNTGFNSIAQSLNVQRIYEKVFDQIIISPTPLWQFVVGQVLGGSLRGMYGGLLILLISIPMGTGLLVTPAFLMVMFLNGMVFAALGVVAAIISKTHADVSRFSTYVILPMTFLCNTFFSLDRMPEQLRKVIELLPLSQTSSMLRTISAGNSVPVSGVVILLLYLALFGVIAFVCLDKKKNL